LILENVFIYSVSNVRWELEKRGFSLVSLRSEMVSKANQATARTVVSGFTHMRSRVWSDKRPCEIPWLSVLDEFMGCDITTLKSCQWKEIGHLVRRIAKNKTQIAVCVRGYSGSINILYIGLG
jgi:hypothetical protein